MEIDWADGVTTRYRHVILRGFCPCAHCQGHHGPVQWVGAPDERGLELAGISEVGNYAIQLTWGDGHASGIYSFRYLRELAEVGEADVQDVETMRFAR